MINDELGTSRPVLKNSHLNVPVVYLLAMVLKHDVAFGIRVVIRVVLEFTLSQ